MFESIKKEDLNFKDLFNLSFAIYRKNFKLMVVIGLLVMVPLFIITQLMHMDTMTDDFFKNSLSAIEYGTLVNPPWTFYLGYFVETVIFPPILTGGVTVLALKTIETGEKGTFNDMMSGSFEIIWKLIFVNILYFLSVVMGLIMFILPSIYFAFLYMFASCAVVVTGRNGMGALRESAKVIRKRWLNAIVLVVLVAVFQQVASYLFSSLIAAAGLLLPGNILENPVLQVILNLVFNILVTYFEVVSCVWFINKYNVDQNIALKQQRGEFM